MSDSLIFVDLIEVKPKTFGEWSARLTDEDFDGQEAVEAAYNAYRSQFQPFRLAIKSGDNQKPLFRSTERYFNRADAIHAAELAFGSHSNVYLREAEHGDVELRLAAG